ncbi:MAG: hypothetical protein WCS77_07130 [Elusimicrobiaceae bacterium]
MAFTVNMNKKQNQQYAIIGGVLLFIIGLWISYPMMTRSSLDASGSSSNFKRTSADLRNWTSVYAGLAPGEAVNAAGKTGDKNSSSLFAASGSDKLMFQYDEDASSETAAGSVASVSSDSSSHGGAGGGASSGIASALKEKLKALSSIGGIEGGGSSSASSGGKSQNLFGANTAKTDFSKDYKLPDGGKSAGGKALNSLTKAEALSADAAGARSIEVAKAGASSAFGGGNVKADLTTPYEALAEKGAEGIEDVDSVVKTLATDKDLDKKNITLPKVNEGKADYSSNEIKQEIIKMILQAAVSGIMGPIFGSVGTVLGAGLTGLTFDQVSNASGTGKK